MKSTERAIQFLAKPLPADIVALITSLSMLEEMRVKISEQFYIAFPDNEREKGEINDIWHSVSCEAIGKMHDRIIGFIEDCFVNHIYED